MSKPKKLLGEIRYSDFDKLIDVPPLTDAQRFGLEEAIGHRIEYSTFARGLTSFPNAWAEIELSRASFIRDQLSGLQYIEFTKVKESLENWVRHSQALLDAITPQSDADTVVWGRVHFPSKDHISRGLVDALMGDQSPRRRLVIGDSTPDPIYSAVSWLTRRATEELEKLKNEKIQESNELWNQPWELFICNTAHVFEQCGLKTSASKSPQAENRNPSVFVRFIDGLITTMPLEVQKKVQSRDALSTRISRILGRRRKRLAKTS